MLFSDKEGGRGAWRRAEELGSKAMYAVERRCNGMGLTCVDLRLRLFDASVLPIECFGCEGARGRLGLSRQWMTWSRYRWCLRGCAWG